MKRLALLLVILAAVASSVSARVTLPSATEFKLPNGMTIEVIQRPQLPIFSLKMTFRAGSIYDPVGKEGLASLASDMLMRGTAIRNDKQIADDIAFGGGRLNSTCGLVAAGFDGEFLTTQGEKAFEIVADLLRHSTFTSAELDKTRTRTLGGLQSRRENPSNVAGDALWEAVLGSSRYAHFSGGTSASIKELTRDDIVRFVADRYTPDNCVLVICGDLSASQVKQWAKKYFGPWTTRGSTVTEETSFPPVSGRKVIIYDKKDATQTQIRLGGNGLPLNTPDFAAHEVARTIYGGSFASRLMNEIRVNRGLTYGVNYRTSSFRPGGIVFVSTFTKNATVGEVIDIILAEGKRMLTEPVPDTEMTHFVNYRNGTYPLDFETNDDLAGVYSDIWLNKLDKGYYQDYQEKLQSVTAPQAMEAAKKYFPLENYRLILVGKADEISEQAKKYGDVTVLPFSEE